MWKWNGILRKFTNFVHNSVNSRYRPLKTSSCQSIPCNNGVFYGCGKTTPLVVEKVSDVANTIMAEVPQKIPQFYRRVLPETCISFYSQEGKKIFHEALDSGHMECYFKLAAQFRTQDEPAFCGLTTLVIALNALEVDPGEVWKGPWRWYHERMLDCCVPISLVEHEGITFNQFVCLADCNSLETKATKSGTGGTLEQFREKVVEYSKRDDAFLILSYSRKTVNQTGDGHFSPVGGYHPGRDLILILDTARFKYPPHWISLELLWEAMHALDKSTGEPRGYLTVKKKTFSETEQKGILTLFKISPSFDVVTVNVLSPGIAPVISKWQEWLSAESPEQESDEKMLENIVKNLNNCAAAGDDKETIFVTQIDVKCVGDLSKAHICVVHQLLTSIEKNPLYKTVTDFINQHSTDHHLGIFGRITSNLSESQEKCLTEKLTTAHFVVMFLLSWPYQDCDPKTHRNNDVLVRLVIKSKAEACNRMLGGESNVLRKQFSSLLNLQQEKARKKKKCGCKT